MCFTGLEIGGKVHSHLPSGGDVVVKSTCSSSFVTAREVLVTRAMLVTL